MNYKHLSVLEPNSVSGLYEIPEDGKLYKIQPALYKHLKTTCRIKKDISVAGWYESLNEESKQLVKVMPESG